MEIEVNSPKPGDTFFVRMNNGMIRKLTLENSLFYNY